MKSITVELFVPDTAVTSFQSEEEGWLDWHDWKNISAAAEAVWLVKVVDESETVRVSGC